MTIRNLALPAIAALALTAVGAAQREVETPVVKTTRPAPGTKGPVIDVVVGGAEEADEELGVDDVRAKGVGKVPGGKTETVSIRRDLASFMTPIVGVTPRRVAPGQSGEVSIVLSMQPGYVLLPGQIDVSYPRSNDAMEFGDWIIDDPKKGLADGPLRGQPIYENYARIRIPFTVGAEAEMAKWAAAFTLTATVTDASSGGSRGESQGHAATQIDVGPALPTPGVARIDPAAAAGGRAADAGSSGATGGRSGGANGGARDPIGSQVVTPESRGASDASVPALPSDPPMSAGTVAGSMSFLILIAGGAVALVIGLLLFGRRS